MSNTRNTKAASLRLTKKEREELEKEADEAYRTFSSYLKLLVMTHPDRKKKKASFV